MKTTPIENILGYDHPWVNQAMILTSIMMQNNWKCVEFHKTKLGKQTKIFTGSEFRFYVWSKKNWTVYVNNEKGICFEVPAASSKQEATDAWNSYIQKMLVTNV